MATAKKELVELKKPEIVEAKIRIVGDTPLITHNWSAKAKKQILEKELGIKPKVAREPKNPIEDFATSMYWLTPMPDIFDKEHVAEALNNGARFGFPVTAFKLAAVSGAYRNDVAKDKVSGLGKFFINSDFSEYYGGDVVADYDAKKVVIVPNARIPMELVEIMSDIPVMREDMVTVGNGAPDLRYRGQFNNCSATLTIGYNVSAGMTLDYIVNILELGGLSCGIGEWRTERKGINGRFHVEIL